MKYIITLAVLVLPFFVQCQDQSALKPLILTKGDSKGIFFLDDKEVSGNKWMKATNKFSKIASMRFLSKDSAISKFGDRGQNGVAIAFTKKYAQKRALERADKKSCDPRLVGIWVGVERNQEREGLEKQWRMERTEDGKFELLFKILDNGFYREYNETGTWYTIENRFYEYHDSSGKTDVYEFEVLDDKRIKFSSIAMSYDTNAEIYSFIDTKSEE